MDSERRSWVIRLTAVHDWGVESKPEITAELVGWHTEAEGQDQPPLPRAGDEFHIVPASPGEAPDGQ